MPRAMELLCGQNIAPGANFVALTMNAGNSLTIRNAARESRVMLLQAWADVQAAGTLRIRSPLIHDNVQGIRLDTVISEPKPLLPEGAPQMLIPQDTLVAELAGSATAGDVESAALLVYYDDVSGADAHFATFEEIQPRIVNLVTVENTLATGVAGGYSGEEALNAEFNLLKGNTDYALLGYLVDVECLAVRWRGIDTSNIGVGGPGDETARDLTRNWFVNLSRAYSVAAIPIFNSANIAGIFLDAHQDENGADVTVTSILAQLR